MTLGIIIGIIVFLGILAYSIYLNYDYIDISEIAMYSMIGLILGFIAWGFFSLCSGLILLLVFKDESLIPKNEVSIEVVGATIGTTGKNGNITALIYTDKEMNTNKVSMSNVTLVDEDIDNPYIISKDLESIYPFISQMFEKTEYEYHGKISELYH